MFYYYDYQTPGYSQTTYLSSGVIFWIVAGVAALAGLVLFFTLFKKSNEGKFQGKKGKIYNFFNFNRFYTEDLVRLLYIMCALGMLAGGIYYAFAGYVVLGLIIAIGGNVLLRLLSELIIICMVVTRRVVSMDKKLSRIEKFYEDDYSDWEDKPSTELQGLEELDDLDCTGYCDSCS